MGAGWCKKAGANCDACPLHNRPAVPTEWATGQPRLAIYAEGPGITEERMGRPLVGESGILVNRTLRRLGIPRPITQVGNTMSCKPARGEPLSAAEWNKAIECCRPRVTKELESLPDGALVMVLGGKALQSLTGRRSITAWRGYPVEADKLHIEAMRESPSRKKWCEQNPELVAEAARLIFFPTLHPAFVLRAPWYLPVWLQDWERAWALSQGKMDLWKWPKFHLHETKTALQQLKEMNYAGNVLGVDVETAGTDPATAPLLCIGVADASGRVVSLNWPMEDGRCEAELRALLANPEVTKVMQNGNYDAISLEGNEVECQGYTFDTLVAHHVVGAQLAHDLGFIASCEYLAPRWKSEFRVTDDRKGSNAFTRATAEELRTYNSQDAYMTALLHEPLKKRIMNTFNGSSLFEEGMRLNHLSKRMTQVGALVDMERRAEHDKRLKKEIADAAVQFSLLSGGLEFEIDEGEAEEAEDRVSEVNPASPQQLVDLFFEKWGCRPRYYSGQTGQPSVNVNTLEEILADDDERTEARKAARALLSWRKRKKLHSTYVRFWSRRDKCSLIASDGRLHPNWKQLTITWRWNSSRPNMQNFPESMRDQIVAPEGMWFVGADYSQLEARIQALLAQEGELIDRFNNDPDFDYHSFFASRLLRVETPTKKQRSTVKGFNFGDNYGAGAKTLQRQLAARGIFMDIKDIEWLQEQKAKMFPGIDRMRKRDLQSAREKGYVEIPWGGPRYYFYLQRVRPTQVYNLPIQGGAARLMNPRILEIEKRLDWSKEAIVFQIHDEVVTMGPDPDRLERILQETMACEITHGNYTMKFPISVHRGKRWSDVK